MPLSLNLTPGSKMETLSKEDRMATPMGDVRICSFCRPPFIRKYSFDSEFKTGNHYKSLFTKRETLEGISRKTDANVVLAIAEPQRIIGFGALVYPENAERWVQLGEQLMMEVKAIEVARSWRFSGIASRMLKMVVDHPLIEDKIAYMVGYSWTWDLEETRKTAREYRAMLMRLFEQYGFQEYQTNEPNVCLKPENVFMCRIGKNISKVIKDRFKWLRFGLTPWAWNVGG
jgi:acetoin utilization protein AcuA